MFSYNNMDHHLHRYLLIRIHIHTRIHTRIHIRIHIHISNCSNRSINSSSNNSSNSNSSNINRHKMQLLRPMIVHPAMPLPIFMYCNRLFIGMSDPRIWTVYARLSPWEHSIMPLRWEERQQRQVVPSMPRLL